MRLKNFIIAVVLFTLTFLTLERAANARFWITHKTSSAPFSPADLTGLRTWLDFSDVATITKNGSDQISAVQDKSTNAYTFTGTGNPLYVANARNGLSVVQFNLSNSMLSATAGADIQQSTVFIVTVPTSSRQYNTLVSSSPQPSGQLTLEVGVQTSLDIYVGGGGAIADTGLNSFPSNTWQRILWTFDVFGGGNAGPNNIYLNRVFKATGNASGGKIKTTPLDIGWDTGTGFYAYGGQMGEVIIYQRVLTLGEQIQVDNYLHDKWGFADTPPAPPTVTFTPTAPKVRQINQRNGSNVGTISVAGATADGTSARARAVVRSGYAGTTTSWQNLTVAGGNVSGSITANAGFYDIEIEVYVLTYLISTATVARVGVGDFFIGAGQSNCTDLYSPLVSTAADDAVQILNTAAGTWARAADPVAVYDSTTLSSVWPALGDLIFAHTGFPVGFAVVGESNTFVHDWIPAGTLYPRITSALNQSGGKVASVLWIQGENDASASTSQSSYATDLISIMDQVQVDAGRSTPFGVAVNETHPYQATGSGTILGQAQAAAHSHGYVGANPDTLGNTFRYDTIHFNTATGRSAHANLWYSALLSNGLIP